MGSTFLWKEFACPGKGFEQMENPGVRNLSSHIVLIKQWVPWEKISLASHTLRAIRVLLWDKRMPCFSYRRKTVPFQLKSKKDPSMLFSYAILFWWVIKYLQTIYLTRQYTFLPLVFKVFLKKIISSFKYLHIYIYIFLIWDLLLQIKMTILLPTWV